MFFLRLSIFLPRPRCYGAWKLKRRRTVLRFLRCWILTQWLSQSWSRSLCQPKAAFRSCDLLESAFQSPWGGMAQRFARAHRVVARRLLPMCQSQLFTIEQISREWRQTPKYFHFFQERRRQFLVYVRSAPIQTGRSAPREKKRTPVIILAWKQSVIAFWLFWARMQVHHWR